MPWPRTGVLGLPRSYSVCIKASLDNDPQRRLGFDKLVLYLQRDIKKVSSIDTYIFQSQVKVSDFLDLVKTTEISNQQASSSAIESTSVHDISGEGLSSPPMSPDHEVKRRKDSNDLVESLRRDSVPRISRNSSRAGTRRVNESNFGQMLSEDEKRIMMEEYENLGKKRSETSLHNIAKLGSFEQIKSLTAGSSSRASSMDQIAESSQQSIDGKSSPRQNDSPGNVSPMDRKQSKASLENNWNLKAQNNASLPISNIPINNDLDKSHQKLSIVINGSGSGGDRAEAGTRSSGPSSPRLEPIKSAHTIKREQTSSASPRPGHSRKQSEHRIEVVKSTTPNSGPESVKSPKDRLLQHHDKRSNSLTGGEPISRSPHSPKDARRVELRREMSSSRSNSLTIEHPKHPLHGSHSSRDVEKKLAAEKRANSSSQLLNPDLAGRSTTHSRSVGRRGSAENKIESSHSPKLQPSVTNGGQHRRNRSNSVSVTAQVTSPTVERLINTEKQRSNSFSDVDPNFRRSPRDKGKSPAIASSDLSPAGSGIDIRRQMYRGVDIKGSFSSIGSDSGRLVKGGGGGVGIGGSDLKLSTNMDAMINSVNTSRSYQETSPTSTSSGGSFKQSPSEDVINMSKAAAMSSMGKEKWKASTGEISNAPSYMTNLDDAGLSGSFYAGENSEVIELGNLKESYSRDSINSDDTTSSEIIESSNAAALRFGITLSVATAISIGFIVLNQAL